jgi:hypothetical protein
MQAIPRPALRFFDKTAGILAAGRTASIAAGTDMNQHGTPYADT